MVAGDRSCCSFFDFDRVQIWRFRMSRARNYNAAVPSSPHLNPDKLRQVLDNIVGSRDAGYSRRCSVSRSVVVVGAGPGGLAAGLQLAGAGLDVTIVEKNSRVGGRTSAISADGFRFDTGPTFFLYPQILGEIFASVGRDLHAEVPMTRLDPQYRLVFGGGGCVNATPVVERMQAEIAKISPDDAARFPAFLEDNRAKLVHFKPILEQPFLGWSDLFKPQMMRSVKYLRPLRSLYQDLGRYFKDPRVRLAFSFQSKYLGMSPFQCPSLFSILSFIEYEHGVHHPQGGCASISEAMARVFQQVGGRLRLGESVDRIVFEGRRAVGVKTESGFYPGRVVVNADFANAVRKMIPNGLRSNWTDRKIESKRYSCSTFMLYLGVEGSFPEAAHHNIYISKDYERNLADIEKKHRLSPDPSFYLQNASVTDPTLAPAGCSTLYLLVPVSQQHPNIDWSKEKLRYRQVALRQLEKLGVRDVERRIRFEKVVTPDDWAQDHGLHLGSTFSMAHSLDQMLHLRPRNRFDDVDGVYLVGGGTHPGSGLPVIFESSRISTRLLLDDLGMSAAYPRAKPEPAPIGEVA